MCNAEFKPTDINVLQIGGILVRLKGLKTIGEHARCDVYWTEFVEEEKLVAFAVHITSIRHHSDFVIQLNYTNVQSKNPLSCYSLSSRTNLIGFTILRLLAYVRHLESVTITFGAKSHYWLSHMLWQFRNDE